jgi:hypothetical protein
MNPLIQARKATPLCLVALACFGLLPAAQALLPPPPPDGGYPNQNTAEGDGSLFSLTLGISNTALGFNALHNNTLGAFNTAIGSNALFSNITEGGNTAIGSNALFSNTFSRGNTAIGFDALFSNTLGRFNTAIGFRALFSNTLGRANTAIGDSALDSNTLGRSNTATGASALVENTTGNNNTANGTSALFFNTTGNRNTANGVNALSTNNDGSQNTATGTDALFSNTTGSFNTADGFRALFSNTAGDNNIALGNSAGSNLTTGSNNIDIGAPGAMGEADTIRIGKGAIQNRTFIAGIRGVTTGIANAVPVLIDSAGQLGTMSSSLQFKKEIKSMDRASEVILALKPVTFHYKSDKTGTPQFGLIAEEVAEVNPDLVMRDENGEIYTVRYEAVNAMLLNEFLKEHRKNEEQEATITRQQKQIEALSAGLQKVTAQLAASKPAPQVADNSQ